MALKNRRAHAKPALFVGCSVEALAVAYAIQENLEHDAEVTVWPQGVFGLSKTPMRSLAQVLDRSEFGIFVFAPDDRVQLRKRTFSAVRDNVIFELGLFAGHLGIDRSFIVIPADGKALHVPTDLTGVTPGTYEPRRRDGNLQAALGPFCNQVRMALKGRRPIRKAAGIRRGQSKSGTLRSVVIHKALYGAKRHRVDVRDALLKELWVRGKVYVGNQLAGDPRPNTSKDLQLEFSYRGIRQKAVLPEGTLLRVPK